MERVPGETAIIDGKLKAWKRYLLEYDLPTWEEIPDIGLYMDQVISLLDTYFDYLAPDIKGNPFATKAMINNYVQAGVVPLSVKKRYYRTHLAYIIIVCLLKQSLSIGQISEALPVDLPEDELHRIYDRFVELRRQSAQYFCSEARELVAMLRGEDSKNDVLDIGNVDDLIIAVAIIGGYSVLLAQKLTDETCGLYGGGASDDR